jgi:hypothetical protein
MTSAGSWRKSRRKLRTASCIGEQRYAQDRMCAHHPDGDDHRRALLTAALAVAQLDCLRGYRHGGVDAVKLWLNTWLGLGAVVVGMARQGYDLELRQFPHGWSAVFYPASPFRSSTALAGTRCPGGRCKTRRWRRSPGGIPPRRRLSKRCRPSSPRRGQFGCGTLYSHSHQCRRERAHGSTTFRARSGRRSTVQDSVGPVNPRYGIPRGSRDRAAFVLAVSATTWSGPRPLELGPRALPR